MTDEEYSRVIAEWQRRDWIHAITLAKIDLEKKAEENDRAKQS